jgi:23S rRNA (pseudouridine1915-N3)-methyltransferase
MKFTLLSVGKNKQSWIGEGCAQYHTFLKKYQSFCEEIVILESKEKEVQKIIEEEGERILKHIPKNAFVVLLDVSGKSYSSEIFASLLQKWEDEGRQICFIIGGAFGVSESVRKTVHERISFSHFTLSHQIIRIVFLEQMFRAMSIMKNNGYHK